MLVLRVRFHYAWRLQGSRLRDPAIIIVEGFGAEELLRTIDQENV